MTSSVDMCARDGPYPVLFEESAGLQMAASRPTRGTAPLPEALNEQVGQKRRKELAGKENVTAREVQIAKSLTPEKKRARLSGPPKPPRTAQLSAQNAEVCKHSLIYFSRLLGSTVRTAKWRLVGDWYAMVALDFTELLPIYWGLVAGVNFVSDCSKWCLV